jgi:hypothetical protein
MWMRLLGSPRRPPLPRPGAFNADAVEWVEKHDEGGTAPLIEMWPDSKITARLAAHLAAAHGIR